jgi:hypothetical protein
VVVEGVYSLIFPMLILGVFFFISGSFFPFSVRLWDADVRIASLGLILPAVLRLALSGAGLGMGVWIAVMLLGCVFTVWRARKK